MIWEPFVLALFLGLIVSAGLYFAYLWPSIEPEVGALDEPLTAPVDSAPAPESTDRDSDHDDGDADREDAQPVAQAKEAPASTPS